MGFELRGARALVTGATGGIGQAIARALSAEGCDLMISGRRREVLEPLAAELGARVVVADLAEPDDVRRLMADAGDLDVLVANAALPGSGAVLEYTHEQIRRNLAVNLEVPMLMARDAALGMADRGRGHIVMIGSVAGKVASGNAAMYNATKFGLRGFSLALRQDLAPLGVGLSIVEPGFVRDAGMFVESGAELPSGVRTVSPEQVAAKVVHAIRKNRAEVVVAPVELRVGTAIGGVFPTLSASLQRAGGADRVAASMVDGQRDKR
ncbi:SDR family NAD(P)-dependent oxidoreductase [Aeromicrobium fastidiosum]|uniref:SDR family NAD(P)-dependent oxidoreductase n=1 Tax=Aeromicrobium fastidiosum TaxID=52699 RepID=A0A641AP10_9ACTN|nr:SDR family NAD(P)-dependent oxidoreductase [Aeromicrobium fastidiosum]KAA1378127.1 SDR family NAD(P)-dependent oxidoreductase [Aeromicrobium fastidiosum]MBP2389075.1 short-subunit dehydrogenase [Aeromicrobium fastidiosum]